MQRNEVVTVVHMNLESLPPFPRAEGVEFRNVPWAFGYCVGSDGSLFSVRVPNKKSPTFTETWFRKSVWKNEDGYYLCHIVGDDGKPHRKLAHTVVLESFVGPRPKGHDALHGNGVPNDNRLVNLKWGTRKENMEDARRHGTLAVRERSGSAKLNELRVRAILELSSGGWSQRDIAGAIGVSQPTVSAVLSGKRWSATNNEEVA